jgi:hypothetical protein
MSQVYPSPHLPVLSLSAIALAKEGSARYDEPGSRRHCEGFPIAINGSQFPPAPSKGPAWLVRAVLRQTGDNACGYLLPVLTDCLSAVALAKVGQLHHKFITSP